MPETTGNAVQQQAAVADSAAIAAAAATAERERITALNKTATQHRLEASFVAQHVSAGTSVDDFNRLALAQIAARQEQTETRSHHAAEVLVDARDKNRVAMCLALAHRVNPTVKVEGEARQFAGMTLLRLAEECVTLAGGNPRGVDRMTLVTAALDLKIGRAHV